MSATERTEDGFTFRDLNHNGRLDVYEDPRRPIAERVDDLLGQMTLEEKAGLMFQTVIEAGEDGGFVRVLASKTDHRLLGVQAVGQHVSEMSNSFAQMLEMGAVLEDVAGVIHVHPTLGEAFHEASLRALGHAIHI